MNAREYARFFARTTPLPQIARQYAVPSKKILTSWIASTNYVRNVAVHQARLFNRSSSTLRCHH